MPGELSADATSGGMRLTDVGKFVARPVPATLFRRLMTSQQRSSPQRRCTAAFRTYGRQAGTCGFEGSGHTALGRSTRSILHGRTRSSPVRPAVPAQPLCGVLCTCFAC